MVAFAHSYLYAFLWCAQFEPESFVDGLLGIGIAGGGTSKEEGKALASRLTEMRKERNERAKTTASTKTASAPASGGGGPAGQMTLQGLDSIGGNMDAMMDIGDDMGDMEMITPGGGGGGNKSARGTNKSKKKKKKKKKVKR